MIRVLSPTMIAVICNRCKAERMEIPVTASKVKRWQDGELIQNVFPELTNDQREMMISHTCPKCWEQIFGPVEEKANATANA